MSLILNFILGSGLKMLSAAVGKWFDNKRAHDLLLSGASIETIKALQSGEDTLSPGGKATRRILALMFCGTWCAIMIWITMVKPDLVFIRSIPFSPGLFSWILGTSNLTVMTVSAGALLWSFFEVISFIAGFYFTKISKGG